MRQEADERAREPEQDGGRHDVPEGKAREPERGRGDRPDPAGDAVHYVGHVHCVGKRHDPEHGERRSEGAERDRHRRRRNDDRVRDAGDAHHERSGGELEGELHARGEAADVVHGAGQEHGSQRDAQRSPADDPVAPEQRRAQRGTRGERREHGQCQGETHRRAAQPWHRGGVHLALVGYVQHPEGQRRAAHHGRERVAQDRRTREGCNEHRVGNSCRHSCPFREAPSRRKRQAAMKGVKPWLRLCCTRGRLSHSRSAGRGQEGHGRTAQLTHRSARLF